MNAAPAFIHPAFASPAPNPRPLPWDRGRDIRALSDYIRAVLAARRLGVRT